MPYAQVTRGLALIFLIILPLAYTPSLGLGIVPLSFVVNMIYFLIDDCAGQMEEPFGSDPNDVALEKTLRRIDKLTAAQLSQFFKKPISNYNIFSEQRSTDSDGKLRSRVRMMGHQSLGVNQHSSFMGDMRDVRDTVQEISKKVANAVPQSPTRKSESLSAVTEAAQVTAGAASETKTGTKEVTVTIVDQ